MFDASTTVTDLLTRVEHLPRRKRDREVTSLARSLSPPDAAAVVAELEERGGLYAQRLAGLVAVSSHNIEWITRAIADPDANKHRVAIGASIRHPERVPIPDEVFEAALHDAPQVLRRLILRSLQGRPQLADRLFDRVRADWGEEVAQWVLPSCSELFVRARLLDILKSANDHIDWVELMKRHTIAVIDALMERLESSGNETCEDLDLALLHIPQKSTPERAECYAKLLNSYPEVNFWSQWLPFDHLVHSDPDALLRRLCGNCDRGFQRVTRKQLKKLRRSNSPVFDEYIGVNPVDSERFRWYLSKIPESKRREAFTRALAKGAKFDYVPNHLDLLDLIPLDEVVKIVPPLINDDLNYETTLRLKKCLPPAEVREYFLEATRRPDTNERLMAWKAFAQNIILQQDPAQLTEFLALFRDRTGNEREELRQGFSIFMKSVPTRLILLETLPILAELHQQDVISSTYSPGYTHIAAMLIQEHPTDDKYVNGAVDFLQNAHEVEEAKDPWRRHSLVRMHRALSIQDAAQLYKILHPHVEAAVKRKHYGLLFDIAACLGPRGVPIRELYNHLEEAFKNGTKDQARTALRLWLRPSKTTAKRLEKALDADFSIIDRYETALEVATNRTDLLDGVFQKTPVGRFRKSEKPWVFPIDTPHVINHWTASQMNAYAEQVQRFVSDSTAYKVTDRANVMGKLGDIPGGAEYAAMWAKSDNKALAEAGLKALAGSQAHIPILLSHGSDDYVHATAPSLFMGIRRLRLPQVEEVVSNMLNSKGNKIVMRKQALRYAAWFLPRTRYRDLIMSVMKEKDTHRDIRVLCVSIIVENLLHEPGALEIVRHATMDEDENVRGATIVPRDRLASDLTTEELETYAELVVSLVDSPHPDLVRLAVHHVAEYVPLSPNLKSEPDSPVFRRLAQMMIGDLEEYRPLMGVETLWLSATIAIARLSEYGMETLGEAMITLIERRTSPDDFLVYSRVRDIASAFVTELVDHDTECVNAMKMISSLLVPYPQYRPFAARLQLLGHSPKEKFTSETLVAHLNSVATLCGSNQLLLIMLLGSLRNLGNGNQDLDTFLAAAKELAGRPDFASGMFAFTIAQLHEPTADPGNQWQPLVEQLRKHPSEEVRMSAWALRAEDKLTRAKRLDAVSRHNRHGDRGQPAEFDEGPSIQGICYPWMP